MGFALAFAILLALLLPATSQAGLQAGEDSPWTWVDRGPKLLDVSCSAPLGCLAVGEGRNLLRSTADGDLGVLSWSSVGLAGARSLVAVECSGERCIAVSGGDGTTAGVSKVFHSEDSGASWSDAAALPPAKVAPKVNTQVAADVACDAAGVCVIAGKAGGIWRSTDGGESWSDLPDSSLGLPYKALTCPTAGACVLVGASGNSAVLRDRDATALAKPTPSNLRAIACESSSFCTAADALGEVISIQAPFRAWDKASPLPAGFDLISLDCPAAQTCVGLSGKGPALRATSRSAGGWDRDDWKKRSTGSVDLLAIDCAGEDCGAAGKSAAWFGSLDTGFGWTQLNQVAKFNGLDCPEGDGAGTCVAGGTSDLGRSTSAGDLWTLPIDDVSGTNVDTVSCDTFPGCVALGKDHTLGSEDGGLTWRNRIPAGTIASGPAAEDCVDTECVGIGTRSVFTTFDAGLTQWFPGTFPTATGEMPKGISCPSPSVCVAATSDGLYRGDLATGGEVQWNWRASDADPRDPINGVDCPTLDNCTAVGFNGQVFTTSATEPDLLHWNRRQIGTGPESQRPPLATVSCPEVGICVAGGERGFIAATINNWDTWSLEQIDLLPKPTIKRFDCQSVNRCVAVGDTVITGDRAIG